jgi:hypothetical protein
MRARKAFSVAGARKRLCEKYRERLCDTLASRPRFDYAIFAGAVKWEIPFNNLEQTN